MRQTLKLAALLVFLTAGPVDAFTTEKRNSQNYAVYVQDSWKPVPRLTLVGGLRFDRVVDDDELFGVRTQSSLEIGPRAGAIYALTADSKMSSTGASAASPPSRNGFTCRPWGVASWAVASR